VYEEVGSAEYHGHDGTRRFFSDLADTWEEIRVEPEAYYDLGETTLLYYLARARGRQSGAEVTMPLAQVCRWRDGLCFYWRTYRHRGDALSDLGVSTEALEPISP
jgi:hypothetical protein